MWHGKDGKSRGDRPILKSSRASTPGGGGRPFSIRLDILISNGMEMDSNRLHVGMGVPLGVPYRRASLAIG